MEDDPEIVDRMIDYLYRLDYDDQPETASTVEHDENELANGRLVINALVYAVADKYEIWSLKDVAMNKTADLVAKEWNNDSFITALCVVWTTTPQCDRGLRNLFITVLCTNRNELVKKDLYINALRNNADLATDMVQALCLQPEVVTKLSSNEVQYSCSNSWCDVNEIAIVECSNCGNSDGVVIERERCACGYSTCT